MSVEQHAVEQVFRRESGRIIAGLIRLSDSFDLAEEAMQDALAAALVDWEKKGIPENPAAWINAVARRKLIDYARRDRTRRDHQDQLLYETNQALTPEEANSAWADDREMNRPVTNVRIRRASTSDEPADRQLAPASGRWDSHG